VEAQSALFEASLRARDLEVARGAALAVEASQPKSPTAHVFLGLLSEAEGRHDAARTAFERALALGPQVPEALQGLVRALLATNRRGEAMQRLVALAAAEPEYALPLVIQGDLLYQDGRHADADGAYAAAATRAPTWWLPVRGRALVAVARGDRAAAIAVLESALPKVAEPLAVRAELAAQYEAAERIDDAVRQYEDILRVSPNALLAANNLAMLLVTHRTDRASLQRAGELVAPLAESRDANYLDTYGWVKLRTGDAATARMALERAVAIAPDVPIVRYHLAMAQLATAKSEEARRNLVAALAGGQTYPGRREAELTLDRLGGPPRS
jgi:tetratricopeptide (TPR) repeat protein